MSKSVKWLVIVGIVLTSIIGAALKAAHRADPKQEEEQGNEAQSGATAQNKTAVVSLDSDTQAREGIRVEAVKQTSMRKEVQGTALVLGVSDLANAQSAYFAAARTKLQRDTANLSVAQSQYERVKKLYQQDENMSLKAMQDAEATYRNSQAQVASDQQDAQLQLDVARQRWGARVTGWIESNAAELDSVLNQREFLAQVTFPPGEVAKPPEVVSLALPGNEYARARFVSSMPEVNPQIQSVSYLYRVDAKSGVAVGMNLAALIPIGRLLQGSVVPESAVVWWQGAAWAYQETSGGRFARRPVSTDTPVANGYFVPENLMPPGTKLVTTGASTLLSNELLAHPQGEASGEEDSDDD